MLDQKTIQYFMALTFAKAKFDYALEHELIPTSIAPQEIEEYEYFTEEFKNALSYFSTCEIEK